MLLPSLCWVSGNHRRCHGPFLGAKWSPLVRHTEERDTREAAEREGLMVTRQMIPTDVLLLHRKFNARSLLPGFKQLEAFLEFPFIRETMVKGRLYIY